MKTGQSVTTPPTGPRTTRVLEGFLRLGTRVRELRRKRWVQLWVLAAVIGFVALPFLPDRAARPGPLWGVLAVAIVPGGLLLLLSVVTDTLATTGAILLTGAVVLNRLWRAGTRKLRKALSRSRPGGPPSGSKAPDEAPGPTRG